MFTTCVFCQKDIKKGSRHHHYKICSKYDDFIIDNQSEIIKLYLDGHSNNSISKKFNVSWTLIDKILKLNNIDKRSLSNMVTDKVKEKTRKTNLERYGADHNFSNDHPSRKKQKEKLIEKYGVDNVFKLKEVQEKAKKTMFKRYGERHPMFLDEFKKKMIDTKIERDSFGSFKGSISKFSVSITNLFKELGFNPKNEFHIYKEYNTGWYSYDIQIKNILFECNGDYWHANPEIYKPDDLIKYPKCEMLAKDVWEKDKIKKEFAINHNYKVYYIWEKDFKASKESVRNKIIEIMKEEGLWKKLELNQLENYQIN